jgi:hypothetical protein
VYLATEILGHQTIIIQRVIKLMKIAVLLVLPFVALQQQAVRAFIVHQTLMLLPANRYFFCLMNCHIWSKNHQAR